ncbi:MAG: RagB/SusD family nutrient uptake outer membrane protein [Mediterranea massiliensis]|nr:RagB/SusD family nutrient uptake outer membrane protein [Mediterranea massiliensis]
MKNYINTLYKGGAAVVLTAMMAACSDSFLEQDPLSFYEPTSTYSTEEGLEAALTMCDKALKTYILDGNWNNVGLSTNYYLTDVGMYAKTDMGGGFQDNFDAKLTPTSGMGTGGDGNYMQRFWNEGFNIVKYANSVLSYVDKVEGLDEATKNAYKGRALFHHSYAYYNLALQFGDIPLVTKLPEVPKQNYTSTSKTAIFQMLQENLEFACKWVPTQATMSYLGMVNQEACKHLLVKVYLVNGEYAKAESLATELISNHGLQLMTEPFGTWQPSGNEETWKVTRNVVWDLHRTPNICHAENKELIMPIINSNDQNFTTYNIMRANFAHWSNGIIRDPHGLGGPGVNYARNAKEYNPKLDWVRVAGRGIALNRTSYHYNKTIWTYDGEMDWQDLRHNREVGNWMEMEDFKYNNPKSDLYGENYRLYATEDYFDKDGKLVVAKGDILCSDTIRSWYPTPLYQLYILDEVAEAGLGQNQFQGAQGKGCNGDMYLFRLADTYLLRAEAKFYQGKDVEAAADVNAVRKRANAKKMYDKVTIGDIMDERARELYMEEFRQAEMVRVSWCLAKSGKPDEWGQTYSIDTWDKQSGTDLAGGSYWFQRCTKYNVFNQPYGKGSQGSQQFEYKVNKHNLHWPVPNSAITANNKGQLRQNYGYDGYSENTPMWTDWKDAVADEDIVE